MRWKAQKEFENSFNIPSFNAIRLQWLKLEALSKFFALPQYKSGAFSHHINKLDLTPTTVSIRVPW